jgi:IclR family KDG regulon transcriptional repressor
LSEQNKTYGNVHNCLNVLLLFLKAEEMTLAELSKASGLNKSYLLKLLYTLKEADFLAQDEQTGRYRLGISCFRLGIAYEERLEIRKIVRPHLEHLSRLTNELVHLGVSNSGLVVLLERINKREPSMNLQFHLSLTSPLYTTGLGKVLLAFSEQDVIEDYLSNHELKPYTPHTVVDPEMLRAQLNQIREQGYCLSYETFESGVSCIAAPIFSKTGAIAAAVSVCAPTIRIMAKEEEIRKQVINTSQKISEDLGYDTNE